MEATSDRTEITRLLRAWSDGDKDALRQLTPLVYQELHRLAATYMAHERTEHTLQPTALVNEAYLRLVDLQGIGWQDRVHFLAVAARTMRRILVDFARSRGYQKRNAGERVAFDESLVIAGQPATDLVALDDALTRLEQIDERKCRIVELRYFGGLQVEETAEALKISPETVARDWRAAKAWLYLQLREGA